MVVEPNRTLRIYDRNKCYFAGTNYEAALTVEQRTTNALLLKVPSRSCWDGIGSRHTAHPRLIICKIKEVLKVIEVIQKEDVAVEVVFDKEYEKATRKQVYQKALEIFNSIG